MSKIEAARVAAYLDPLWYVEVEDQAELATDTARMAAAGAALVLAIYHSDAASVLALPDPVTRAYVRACKAYGIG
jgi:hypothetical protein